MMKRSRQVILNALAAKRAPLDDCVNDLRDRRYRHHSCIVLEKGPEAAELEVEIASLEKRLRQLVEEEAR